MQLLRIELRTFGTWSHLSWIKGGDGNCCPGIAVRVESVFLFFTFLPLLTLDLAHGVMLVKTQLDECLAV